MSKKLSVAITRGCTHFCNVYWKEGGGLRFADNTYTTLEAARENRMTDGTFVCTVKVTTQMEVA